MEMDESSESSPSSSVSSLSERHPPPQPAAKNTATKPKQKIKEAGIIDEDDEGKEVPTSIKIPKQRDMTSSSSSTTTTSRVLDFSPRQFSLLNLPNNRDSDQDYTPESIQDGDSLLDASSSSEEDDGEDIVVDTIIACRKDTIQNWYNRCSKINTSEVMNGSLFYDPSSMSHSSSRLQDSNEEERFLVKWAEMSYIHCSWETEKVLVEQTANGTYQLNSFFKRFVESGYRFDIAERRGGEFFDHDLVQIDRILEVQAGDGDAPVVLDKESDEYEDGNGQQLMVKWCNLPYSESTYEYERDLILMGVEYESHYEVHLKRQKKPSSREGKNNLAKHDRLVHHLRRLFRVSKDTDENVGMNAYVKELQAQEFRNGGKLRDYQAEGVAWMVANYVNGRSSILADVSSSVDKLTVAHEMLGNVQ
jgi:SNF2 family DNA or RNA helicase